MNEYQRFALNHFLADYPNAQTEGKTFDEVLEMIDTEADGISVWCPFEFHQPEDVVEFINDLVDSLTGAFVPKAEAMPVG